MSNRDELEALAARCETEEPSRHLDCAIYRAAVIHPSEYQTFDANYRSTLTDYQLSYLLGDNSEYDNPSSVGGYTTSLDSAVTLVPDWCQWSATGEGTACSYEIVYDDRGARLFGAKAKTPALALCAAALRALAASCLTQTAPKPKRKPARRKP